jgi:hypothetical protein
MTAQRGLQHACGLLLYTFMAQCHELYTFLCIFLKHVQSIFNGKGIKNKKKPVSLFVK